MIAILGGVFFTAAQNIPSGDFESWTNRTAVSLDSFTTAGLVSRTSDAHSGNYAVRMDNKRVEGDQDITSFVTNGIPVTNNVLGGQAYDEAPMSMRFFAKYDLADGDHADIVGVFKLNGSPIAIVNVEVRGNSADTFVRYSVPINWQVSAIPDTLVILMSSKDLDTDTVSGDGYVIVDDIHFVNIGTRKKPLANGDFEHWVENNRAVPTGWFTVDDVFEESSIPGVPQLVAKTSDAHGGSSALSISNAGSGRDLIPGIALTGNDENNFEKPAFKVSKNWKFIEGWYKYDPDNGDSALVMGGLFTMGVPIAIVRWGTAVAVSDWTYFSADLTYITNIVTADSATVAVAACNPDAPRGGKSKLVIDDLKFTDNPVGISDVSSPTMAVYPTPFRSRLYIALPAGVDAASYSIINMQGRLVATGTLDGANKIEIQEDLSPGAYLLRVSGGSHIFEQKIIKE